MQKLSPQSFIENLREFQNLWRKLNIFTRINTLGEPLSPQEIRHAIYNGKSTKLLKELSESEEFVSTVNPTPAMKKRMNVFKDSTISWKALCLKGNRVPIHPNI